MRSNKKEEGKTDFSIGKFCSNPFISAHISTGGNISFCCPDWISENNIGNVFKESFEDIWNSKTAQTIRASILDGSFKFCKPENCSKIISGKIYNHWLSEDLKRVIKNKAVLLDYGPELLALHYDYSCNLHCNSCRSKILVLSEKETKERIQFQNSLLQSEYFRNVKQITVTGGGEVFASKVFLDLLKKINKNRFPDLKINLRTNGQLLTPKNWDLIKSSHYAIQLINISIDAAKPETYHKLRRGGDFYKLLKNLEYVQKIKKEFDLKVKLNFVVQDENYQEMKDFVELGKRYEADIVAFTKIQNFGTYTQKDFKRHTIHSPSHPEHKNLLEGIKDPVFDDPIIKWANMSAIRKKALESATS